VALRVEENFTAVQTERLRQGERDAIIIFLPYEEPGILTLPFHDEPFVMALPAGHPWARKKNPSAPPACRRRTRCCSAAATVSATRY
jgi:LysR family hydrogen peroxide-inducible transcriptional activator